MKSVIITGQGQVEVKEIPVPEVGPHDVKVKIKAVGICGSDLFYIQIGGIPPRQGNTPIGHEPVGIVEEVGTEVEGVQVGDHIVMNPQGVSDGIFGNGGEQGALADYLVLRDAKEGIAFRVIPKDIPFEVAALNEPMAVAAHAVNRLEPKPGQKAAVFGAGPIGLGALLALKSKGVEHVVVIDILPTRLEKALQVGADAVINSLEEDVREKLIAYHGDGGRSRRGAHPDTDLFLDAAGVSQVIQTVTEVAKHLATLSIPAVHKKPVEVDFGSLLTAEITIRTSQGYPSEIFEVTDDLIANWEKYALIVSDQLPFVDVLDALKLAGTPGAADKVIVTFD